MERIKSDAISADITKRIEASKKTAYSIYKESVNNNWSKQKIKQELIDNGIIVKKCNYHDLEFVGDGLWKCKICGLKKTNNLPHTNN